MRYWPTKPKYIPECVPILLGQIAATLLIAPPPQPKFI